jgi:hypothetical protein
MQKISQAQVITKEIQTIAEEFGSQASILLSSGGYIYGAWHSKDIQLEILSRFSRMVQDFSRVLPDRNYSEFVTFPMTRESDVAAVIFQYNDLFLTYCIIVPKFRDEDKIQEGFLTKRAELEKILNMFEQSQ